MLDDDEFNEYEEETYMLLNPTDRYLEAKGKREGKREMAIKMIEDGFSIEYVAEISELSKEDILNVR